MVEMESTERRVNMTKYQEVTAEDDEDLEAHEDDEDEA